jgi:hypothetical protein
LSPGLVFLSGMYVNLAYRQLGTLARRLLPGGKDDAEEQNGGENGVDERDGGGEGINPDSIEDARGTGDDE